jgi:hypothetical protein
MWRCDLFAPLRGMRKRFMEPRGSRRRRLPAGSGPASEAPGRALTGGERSEAESPVYGEKRLYRHERATVSHLIISYAWDAKSAPKPLAISSANHDSRQVLTVPADGRDRSILVGARRDRFEWRRYRGRRWDRPRSRA